MQVHDTIHWLLRHRDIGNGGDVGGADQKEKHDKKKEAHSVFIRLVLPPYTIHFKSPTYMRETTLDLLDRKVCKETLKSTAQDAVVREAIGTDIRFWQELVLLLRAAIPSLERRSFSIWDPSSVDYESVSGALIASHYPYLWKDLERLNDLISISRNVLPIGAAAQDLAADAGLDAEIFRLINCCVRVAARGYDGEAITGEEEKWQCILNAYKKLLITSLQYLNNAVAQNERRKLALWIALFDHGVEGAHTAQVWQPEDIPETSTTSLTDVPSNPSHKPEPPVTQNDLLAALGTDGKRSIPQEELDRALPLYDDEPWTRSPLPKDVYEGRETMQGNGYVLFTKRIRDEQIEDYNVCHRRNPTLAEQFLEMPRRWSEMREIDQAYWQSLFDDAMAKYRQDMAVYEAKQFALAPRLPTDAEVAASVQSKNAKKFEEQLAILQNSITHTRNPDGTTKSTLGPSSDNLNSRTTFTSKDLNPHQVVAEDLKMLFTADAGLRILDSGKAELMKRLDGYEPADENLPPSRQPDGVSTRPVKMLAGHCIERTRSMSVTPPLHHVTSARQERKKKEREVWESKKQEGLEKSHAKDAFQTARAGEVLDEQDEAGEDESEVGEGDDDEDYPGSTEDGRGLLTDVPLILGPSEIEVLPMLIMSGIVPPASATRTKKDPHDPLDSKDDKDNNTLLNMHIVRTHLFLSQTSGRNLLRELLIFVAAWDLREEELYFKFMVKIMEAILTGGLMPYCYHSFRDRSRSKDIISPAQAVIMKLLTCIFRSRGGGDKTSTKVKDGEKQLPSAKMVELPTPDSIPSRVDLHILNFIFTEFRQHIIPQTCALIFLQGQIHAGRASPEDFPLNLWDMERMYEGVYQYLEFFAVCCEESSWKAVLGGWEMGSELVTLLRELEGGIPKLGPLQQVQVLAPTPRRAPHLPKRSVSVDSGLPAPHAPQVGTPFDIAGMDTTLPPLPLSAQASSIFEPETPLAFPEDLPTLPSNGGLPPHDLTQHDQEEPSDFEWRNLKKLTALVLSSLVWKNKAVQDQVRVYGGLEALVACCRTDEHNPYIREHAIMCLRFAVEGNEENGRVIREMAGRTQQRLQLERGAVTLEGGVSADVPKEVLDTGGYETFMDPRGQVALRRKDGLKSYSPSSPSPSSVASASVLHSSIATGLSSSPAAFKSPRHNAPKMTAEKAAELMQTALRDLPLGDRLVTEKQKQEALAKLDRAFESTERALRGAGGVQGDVDGAAL